MSRTLINSLLRKRNFHNFLFRKFSENSVKFQHENPVRPTWSQIRWYASTKNEVTKDLVRAADFENVENKNKNSYIQMVNIYKSKEINRRAHVEFIYSALKYMKEFGVEKDLEVYKSLIDVLPKGKMVPRNLFQAEFMHYPKQQQCAIDLLEQMEENGVMPDWDMEDQLLNVFGSRGYPLRRYWRMMYWMPKFKNASPFPLPDTIPNDTYQLAMLAIKRIMSVDSTADISVYKTSDIESSLDDTWIVSGQSPTQMELLKNISDNTPIYVEGRFRIWLKNKAITYFTLRADVVPKKEEEEDFDDVSKLANPLFARPNPVQKRKPSVHEQEDGVILAVCCTGTSSRDSLLSWIRSLEKTNPQLTQLPIVFTLRAPPDETSVTSIDNEKDPILKRIEESEYTK